MRSAVIADERRAGAQAVPETPLRQIDVARWMHAAATDHS
jgi:hypothetical protein